MSGRGVGAPLLVRFAVRCYPWFWRERWGDDAETTAAELVEDGELSWRVALNLLSGAAAAHRQSTGLASAVDEGSGRTPSIASYACAAVWLPLAGSMVLIMAATGPGSVSSDVVAMILGLLMLGVIAVFVDVAARLLGIRWRRAAGPRRAGAVVGALAGLAVGLGAAGGLAILLARFGASLALANGNVDGNPRGRLVWSAIFGVLGIAAIGSLFGVGVAMVASRPEERVRAWAGRFAGGGFILSALMVCGTAVAGGWLVSQGSSFATGGHIWTTPDWLIQLDPKSLLFVPLAPMGLSAWLCVMTLPWGHRPGDRVVDRSSARERSGRTAWSVVGLLLLTSVMFVSCHVISRGYTCACNGSAAQSNLQTAVTAAYTYYRDAGDTFLGAMSAGSSEVSTLTQIDTGLVYVVDAPSSRTNVISVDLRQHSVVFADYAPGQSRCFFITYIRGRVAAPVTGETAPGTYYGVLANQNPSACVASSHLQAATLQPGRWVYP